MKSYSSSVAAKWLVLGFTAYCRSSKEATDAHAHIFGVVPSQVTAGSASQWHFQPDAPSRDIN